MYCCTIDIPSEIDEKRLYTLRDKYQIPDEVNPCLAALGEWCCTSNSGVFIYEAYLLGGLRLPLNAFARELLHRLGIGPNQLNPNAWRIIVSMQVLWREVFDGNCPLTMDEFLYYYKPSEISKSLGFYQFLARGSSFRLIRSLPLFDRRWKTVFFFVSGYWVGNPVEVDMDLFPPYTGEMGHLHSKGMLPFLAHLPYSIILV